MTRNIFSVVLIFFSSLCYSDEKILSITFSDAAALAVASSVDLNHSRSSQKIMEGAWKWGLRAYFPKFNLIVSENDRLQQFGSDSFVKNYGINIEQFIFDYGTIMSRKMERMEIDLSAYKISRMADEIAEAAIAVYRNVLSSRAILDIKKDTLFILEEQRRILKEEVRLGLALEADLASADISLADVKIEIYALRLESAEIEKQFAEILGLNYLPVLNEKIDINRPAVISSLAANFAVPAAASFAKEQNPDLIEARHSIKRKQLDLKYASRSWIPSVKLIGNFGLTGESYPLTRYNWSVGVNVEFSGPWIQNRFNVNGGWELSSMGKFDKTAAVQNSLTPLPEPALIYGKKQAAQVLALEKEKYNDALEKIGRVAANAVEKCVLAEEKRILACESAALGRDRCRVEEIRLGLGQITRHKLMEILTEQTQREIGVIQAAIALLEAERDLERLLDLRPGGLDDFISSLIIIKNFRSEK